MATAVSVLNLPQVDAAVVALGLLLAAIVAITIAYAGYTSIRGSRHDERSIRAIDFVRRSFANRLDRSVPMERLLLEMVEALRDSLKLDAAEAWLATSGGLERVASEPDRGPARLGLTAPEESIVANAQVSGQAWARIWLPQLVAGRGDTCLRIAPLSHSGQLLGLIVAERERQGEELAADADVTLGELAREVGVALHNRQMDTALEASLEEVRQHAQALQASRARIVATANAERRRIERNLHDGAHHYLVAMSVKLGLAQQLSERDPARAKALIEELKTDLQVAIDELRALAHGIYPPLLASQGLGEALAAAARRSRLPTRVDAASLGRYPAELEAAVYFCCLEALQNAAKYAGDGAAATVLVREEEGALLFEVADTGAGFDAQDSKAGAGLTNMADRLGAVGGTLRLESQPGRGTRIQGVLPLRSVEPVAGVKEATQDPAATLPSRISSPGTSPR
jgi:signal transduction histidine kinase